MSRVGLVILNYNDSERTIELLDEIAEYDVWDKIVVVDNKSTDNSFEILKKCTYEKVDVIESRRNGGYSYGNNFGIKYLDAHYNIDICVIANPDIRVAEEVIHKMVRVIGDGGRYSATAPVMLDKNGKYTLNAYKRRGYYQDVWEYLVPMQYPKKQHGQFLSNRARTDFAEIVPVHMLPGSLFAIAIDALKKINYLDEGVFLYCEERILAERMHRYDLHLGLLINESYTHLHEETRDCISQIRQMERVNSARIYYYKKYRKTGLVKLAILKGTMAWHLFWYKKYIKKSDS